MPSVFRERRAPLVLVAIGAGVGAVLGGAIGEVAVTTGTTGIPFMVGPAVGGFVGALLAPALGAMRGRPRSDQPHDIN